MQYMYYSIILSINAFDSHCEEKEDKTALYSKTADSVPIVTNLI